MNLKDYEALPYRVELTEDTAEGGFVAACPELKGCLTCGETREQAIANARDAKSACLAAALEDGIEIPLPRCANAG